MKCSGCDLVQDEEQFPWKNQAKGLRQTYCKTCKSSYNKTWYENHKDGQKSRAKTNGKRYYAEAKAYTDKMKSVPCTDCGRTFPTVCMDFDHLGDKDFTISHKLGSVSLDRIKEEVLKCEVVCACCHRIRTSSRLSLMDKAGAS